jgi:hypothetical protein
MSPHEVDQRELPLFKGRFSFDHNTLQANLKNTFPNYDFYDPRTWPRVAALQIKNSFGVEYYGIHKLPEGVAYDREIVERYTRHYSNYEASVNTASGAMIKRSHYAQLFPYFYQTGGTMRKTGYMTAAHVISWIRPLAGKTPETGKKEGPRSLSVIARPTTSTATSTKKSTIKTTNQRPVLDTGATDIANKILEIHKAQTTSTTREVESLKQELADVQRQLSREKERADHSDRARVNLRIRASNSIREIKQDLVKGKNRADMAESTSSCATTAHCQELPEVQRELETERSRANTLESDITQLKDLVQDMRTRAQEGLEKEKYRADMAEWVASCAKTTHGTELAELRADLGEGETSR